MCQEKNTFILCSCATNKNEKDGLELLKDYTWSLTRFVGFKETLLRGKIVGPKDDLGNGLNLNRILNDLNANNIFDFEYQPAEKDCLTLTAPTEDRQIKYIKVLFKDGKWAKGRNPAFISISNEIANGKIMRLTNRDIHQE